MKNEKLKRKRLRNGFTQKAIAEEIGMKLTTYTKKENGLTKFNIDEALKIAKILNCDVKEIFFD